MFVAEAPGKSEDAKGRPFIGRSGRVLRRTVLQLTKGNMAGIALGNVVRCRPTKIVDGSVDNRTPTVREVGACRGAVLRDIERLKPKIIVLLGDSAAKGIARNRDGTKIDPKTPVNAMRGRDFVVPLPSGKTLPAVATYHFSHVYRNPNIANVFREDIGKAIRRARGQLGDYSQRGKPTIILDTVPKVKKFLWKLIKGLTKDDVVAFDYETESLKRFKNTALCCSFSYRPDQAFVIPLQHAESPWNGADYKTVVSLLRKFFRTRNPSFRALVPHNLKFEDITTIDQFGTHILLPVEDTQQRAHALNEDRKGTLTSPYKLKVLVEEHLGFYHYSDEDIAPTVELRNAGRLKEASMRDLAEYNGMDAYCTYRLYQWQKEWAIADGYLDGFNLVSHELQGPVSLLLSEMERNGLLIDRRQVETLLSDNSEVRIRMDEIVKELYNLDTTKKANQLLVRSDGNTKGGLWANREDPWVFKIGADDAKRALFFDVLELKPVKYTKKTKKPSVGVELFKKYEGVREIDLYEEYTQLRKIISTYVKSVGKFLYTDTDMRHDSRIRTHFNPIGTITGRPSSSNPNILNIPARRKDAASKAIKRLYIVPPGYCLIVADYSQAEVRWLAEATKDPFLAKAFIEAYAAKKACRLDPTAENKKRSRLEGDFHRHTAAAINKVELAKVSKSMRSAAKTIVFGLVYGMTTHGLASRLGVGYNEAEEFIEQFFARFPTAKKWLDQMELDGFKNGYVISPMGRRKLINSWLVLGNDSVGNLPKFLWHLRSHYNHEMRVCRNAPIQGAASDTNFLACCRILEYIMQHKKDWKIVNTVYDSVLIEVPFPEVIECIETAQSIMEDPQLFAPFGLHPKVPFAADFSVGVNWGDQFEIAYDSEVWDVECLSCKTVRTEEKRPTNRRCEECGSTEVVRWITEGPRDLLLKRLDREHNLSSFWS